MDAEDVASAVINVLSQPGHVEIHDILLRSVEQPD
jgi:NADP-dependent 3-hydroxy acid dehydrogenase YdfG